MALQPDGYLGFVIAPGPMVRALVEDINIKLKAAYSKEALTNGATVEEMALRSGSGAWKTRDSSTPALDPRCP